MLPTNLRPVSSTKTRTGIRWVIPVEEMSLAEHAHEMEMQGWAVEELNETYLRAREPRSTDGNALNPLAWFPGGTLEVERKNGEWRMRTRANLKHIGVLSLFTGFASGGAWTHGLVQTLAVGSAISLVFFGCVYLVDRRSRTTVLEF